MKAESRFGFVLLVLNAIPQSEKPPDPTTDAGARQIADEVIESLIEHRDDMVANDTTIPVLLVAAPQLEGVVKRATAHRIAGRYSTALLSRMDIPHVKRAPTNDLGWMLPLLRVRAQFLEWLAAHRFELIMVRPVCNHGARLERRVLAALTKDIPTPPNGPGTGRTESQDIRPLAVEVVPFDGKDGPILGLYQSHGVSRPAAMPAAGWHAQKYRPQAADDRLTGTVYLNLPLTRLCLQGTASQGLTPLDQWSVEPLAEIASSSWQDQPAILENALSALMAILKARPLRCPPERGVRGYRRPALG